MNIQEALEAPIVYSVHFPASFHPRTAYPDRVMVEDRMSPEVCEGLELLGHEVLVTDASTAGKVMGIRYDAGRGVISGGVSPKRVR